MTTQFYPRPPAAGSNAIGSFIIGVSAIGDLPPFDWHNTVMSQYANSPILMQLIDNFDQYIDQTANMDNFYDLIWNVQTAMGYGLDVWGRIVGISRTVAVPDTTYLGFDQASPSVQAFGYGVFYAGTTSTSNYVLGDDAYRTLIFAKALANISDGSIPSVNQLLLNLFPHRGDCYITDGLNMTMTYTFKFALSAVELAIVSTSGVLPTPCGVKATVVVSP